MNKRSHSRADGRPKTICLFHSILYMCVKYRTCFLKTELLRQNESGDGRKNRRTDYAIPIGLQLVRGPDEKNYIGWKKN